MYQKSFGWTLSVPTMDTGLRTGSWMGPPKGFNGVNHPRGGPVEDPVLTTGRTRCLRLLVEAGVQGNGEWGMEGADDSYRGASLITNIHPLRITIGP